MNHHYFMEKTLNEAQKALDENEFPVGCALVYDNQIIATGKRTGTNGINNEIDHAEIIALRKLSLLFPYNRSKITLYTTLEPCLMCYGAIIISGIKNIVYAYEDIMGGGTDCDLSVLKELYQKSRINIISGIHRDKSKKLFQDFFLKHKNGYLQNTLLASYTLKD